MLSSKRLKISAYINMCQRRVLIDIKSKSPKVKDKCFYMVNPSLKMKQDVDGMDKAHDLRPFSLVKSHSSIL
jgi:hypothetical protein